MSRQATKRPSATAASIIEQIGEGRIEEAGKALLRIARTDPGHDMAWLTLGVALSKQDDTEGAEKIYRRLMRTSPGFFNAYYEMGTMLLGSGRGEEALACFEHAAKLNPGFAPTYNNLGVTHRYLGHGAAARASFARALEVNPDFPGAQANLGMTMVQEGDFDGLALIEHRLKQVVPGQPTREGGVPILRGLWDKPRWDGGDLRGKHIVIWAEQGMGDNLMMMRYLPLLRARGAARITALCIPALAQTMGTLADHVLVDPDDITDYRFDVYCPSMSLPLAFGTRLETIPAAVPYLQVPAAARLAWANCLAGLSSQPGLKVGLVWAGGKAFKRDALRSLVLRQLAPLMAVEGIHWISLQKGQAAEDLADVDWRILDWAYHCDDLMDTAALIDQLDLVITVDTSVAHLAGALNKPVWMMSRFEGEWRWMTGRTDSPWYPSMRIFQQPALGDWDSVLASLAAALAPLAAEAGPAAPLTAEQWAACVRDCVAGPQRAAKKGFFARWFG
jgi:Tfp pilus assembly protein PilF